MVLPIYGRRVTLGEVWVTQHVLVLGALDGWVGGWDVNSRCFGCYGHVSHMFGDVFYFWNHGFSQSHSKINLLYALVFRQLPPRSPTQGTFTTTFRYGSPQPLGRFASKNSLLAGNFICKLTAEQTKREKNHLIFHISKSAIFALPGSYFELVCDGYVCKKYESYRTW